MFQLHISIPKWLLFLLCLGAMALYDYMKQRERAIEYRGRLRERIARAKELQTDGGTI